MASTQRVSAHSTYATKVREHLEIHTAVAVVTQAGQFRIPLNPRQGRPHLLLEPNTQAGLDRLIVRNGVIEFSLGFLKDPQIHAG
jgi:hypothetical protein